MNILNSDTEAKPVCSLPAALLAERRSDKCKCQEPQQIEYDADDIMYDRILPAALQLINHVVFRHGTPSCIATVLFLCVGKFLETFENVHINQVIRYRSTAIICIMTGIRASKSVKCTALKQFHKPDKPGCRLRSAQQLRILYQSCGYHQRTNKLRSCGYYYSRRICTSSG
jgi:hypothetical protein